MKTKILTNLLDDRAQTHRSAIALRQKRFGIWHEKTWSDVRDVSRALGQRLAALGLRPGDRLAILADPSQEAVVLLFATLYAGGVPVLIHPTLPADETARHFTLLNCEFAYCDTVDRADKILGTDHSDCNNTPLVIVLDSRDAEDRADAGLIGFDALMSGGGDPRPVTRPRHDKKTDSSLITLSSGTDGPSRPVELAQETLIQAATAFRDYFGVSAKDSSIAILPFGHPVELGLSVILPLLTGLQPAFSESARTMRDDMIDIAPTIIAGPPRLWQKLRGDILLAAQRTGLLRRRLFVHAMGSLEHHESGRRHGGPGLVGRFLVAEPLRARLGLAKARVSISTGDAPVSEVGAFFDRLGMPIRNAYSVSGAGGIVGTLEKANDAEGLNLSPLPGFDFKVSEDGLIELCAYGNWIATNDHGAATDKGLLFRGRADKQLPAGHAQLIESALKADPLVREAISMSDDTGGIIAIVQPDSDLLGAWANRHQLLFTNFQSLIALSDVQDALHEVVSASVSELPANLRPSGYVVLPYRLGLETGELTPIMAPRRPVLAQRMKDLRRDVRPIRA